MTPQRHEDIGEALDVLERCFIGQGFRPKTAKALAHIAVRALAQHFQGCKIYIPQPGAIDKAARSITHLTAF